MSKEKLARRKKMGDDPTAMSKSNSTASGMIPPQPMPGMPQGAGNMMNNPQVGQSMGGGAPQPGGLDPNNPRSPYGDPVFDKDTLMKTGSVGYAQNTGMPQNLVAGTKYNRQPYNSQQQPYEDSMRMMEPMHMAEEASSRAVKLYGAEQTPSYQIGPLGMMGTPVEMAVQAPNPGQFPPQMRQQTNNQLNLQGVPDVSAAVGMNTGRGGGRNQKAKGEK